MEKARLGIYTLAGFYIIILSYFMYKGLAESSGGELILIIVFMIVFALIGIGLITLSTYKMYKLRKTELESKKINNK